MTPEQIIELILGLIDKTVNDFNNKIPDIQLEAMREAQKALSRLDLDDGSIRANITNLRKIDPILNSIKRSILNDTYKENVREFVKSYTRLTKLQTQYFETVFKDFGAPKAIEEVRKQAVEEVILLLTDEGLQANLIDPLREMMDTAVKSGDSLFSLESQIRNNLVDNKAGVGSLSKLTDRVTTDSLNQYAAGYNKIVTDDLQLEWNQYVGSLVRGSRDFCEAMVKKRYVHNLEIAPALKGRIGKQRVRINSRTRLPFGLIRGTNTKNFAIRRGGYKCNHLLMPVATESVPKRVIEEFRRSRAV